MSKDKYSKAIFYLLLFISIIASGFVLKLASHIIVPVMFAIFLSLVMLPLLEKLKKKLLHIALFHPEEDSERTPSVNFKTDMYDLSAVYTKKEYKMSYPG